ncbi:MAG: TlpA family protein disulfide reductase [Burkholderiales bacterium]|nr:MAG: TlpA family protein disulfide reductase [Burkholderiales bacterium]
MDRDDEGVEVTPGRRRFWTAGVALVAAAAGGSLAWWRYRPAPLLSGAEEAFWSSRFEDPQGLELVMASWRGQPLLVNFWATWCPPCVEELPLLNAFHDRERANGWQVIGLAVDRASAVLEFTQRLPLHFPVGMAGLAGTELSKTLGNVSGGLPFTVVFGRDGAVLHRKIGKVSEDDLAQWARLGA